MTIILIYFILISTFDSELKWHAMRSVHISVMTNVTLYSGSVTYSEILSICTISVMTLSMESSLSLATLTRWWSRDRLGTPDLTSISRSKLDSLIPAASPCRLPCIYNTEQCHLNGLIISALHRAMASMWGLIPRSEIWDKKFFYLIQMKKLLYKQKFQIKWAGSFL